VVDQVGKVNFKKAGNVPPDQQRYRSDATGTPTNRFTAHPGVRPSTQERRIPVRTVVEAARSELRRARRTLTAAELARALRIEPRGVV